jgi:hypothetical protein
LTSLIFSMVFTFCCAPGDITCVQCIAFFPIAYILLALLECMLSHRVSTTCGCTCLRLYAVDTLALFCLLTLVILVLAAMASLVRLVRLQRLARHRMLML